MDTHNAAHRFSPRTSLDGFCMALADSVPGVSGGTIAFILGFYDQFIGSIHDLVFARGDDAGARRRAAVGFLLKLGVGWIVGMALAALVLTSLLQSHTYAVCSLFMGFVVASLPLVAYEEREVLKGRWWGLLFSVLGALVVVGLASAGDLFQMEVDLSNLTAPVALYVFVAGAVAISAMFLPGISGSTILLVLGLYIPVMGALRQLLSLDFAPLPAVVLFVLGMLVGAVSVVKGIQVCLKRYRTQTVFTILGMMAGSLYAIALGPTTLDVPRPPLGLDGFNVVTFLVGAALVAALQVARMRRERAQA